MIEYEPPRREPIPKRLLVVGSPRSGTHFFAKLLQNFGMRVKHERMGEDGTVNSAWLAMKQKNDTLLHVEGRQHYTFDKILHIVRHPLPTIESLSRELSPVFWEWQYAHSKIAIDDPHDLERVSAFWVFWTDGCQHLCDTHIRLEDIAHLGDVVGKGKQLSRRIEPLELGCMQEEVEKRCEIYGYKL